VVTGHATSALHIWLKSLVAVGTSRSTGAVNTRLEGLRLNANSEGRTALRNEEFTRKIDRRSYLPLVNCRYDLVRISFFMSIERQFACLSTTFRLATILRRSRASDWLGYLWAPHNEHRLLLPARWSQSILDGSADTVPHLPSLIRRFGSVLSFHLAISASEKVGRQNTNFSHAQWRSCCCRRLTLQRRSACLVVACSCRLRQHEFPRSVWSRHALPL
jgi:hypothetical protein